MKRWLLTALLFLYGMPVVAQAPLPAKTIYSQDFESAPIGKVTELPGGVHDNTYAGGATPLSVLKSVDPRLGNVLQAQTHGFAQIVLGEMALKKGAVYRVSLDVSSRGNQQVTLMLRYVPAPYTGWIASQEPTNETLRHISFLGRAPEDSAPVGLFLIMTGFTTLTIDNVKVEEVSGDLPPGDPPVEGNLVPNAGYEVGGDGWFTRGPVEFTVSPEAYEGRRVAVMHGVPGQDILSSTFFRLSFLSDYLVQAHVKAVRGSPHAHLYFAGKEAGLTVGVGDGWKTVSLRVRPQPPGGKIIPYLDEAFGIECQGSGTEMHVDAVSVQAVPAGQDDAPYRPKVPLELGLSSDAPEGALTVGETATVTALASASVAAATLQIRDEDEHVTRILPLRFASDVARLRLPVLPPGYWHLVAIPKGAAGTPGETFLSVIPKQPVLPVKDWFYGTHVPDNSAMRQACWKLGLHWDRLHDTGQTVKWNTVQPDRPDQWLWHDDEIARRQAEGEALMGNLDILPAWIAKQDKSGKPIPPGTLMGLDGLTAADEPLWQDFCRRTGAHYKGRMDTFEVLNESSFYMSPTQYVHVLNLAASGLRAGNPQVKIVAPAVGGSIDDGWLRDVVRLGAGKDCDVLSYHGYGLDTWASLGGPEALQQGVRDLHTASAQAGTPGLPIWDSECGVSGIGSRFAKYYQPGLAADARETARMFPKSAACAKAGGLGRIFYYAAFQPSVASEANGDVFSFGDVNSVLKMPFQPLGVAISLLEGREFVRQDAADKARGIVHLVYRGRGAEVHVLWKLNGAANLPVPAGTSHAVNLWGRDLPRSRSERLGQDVVYFVVPQR